MTATVPPRWRRLLTCALIAAAALARAQPTYTNPLADSLEIADPFVLRGPDSLYYLYGTTAADGFRAWRSRDLVDWAPLGYVYRAPDSSWGRGNFWAPEVHAYRGRYYLAFSAKGPGDAGLRLCLAVADHPGGPFAELAAPWLDQGFSAIDAHLFVDADGAPYAFYEMVGVVGEPWAGRGYSKGSILGQRLGADLLAPAPGAEPVTCLTPTQPWELPPDGLAHSVEGMTVFRVDSLYYMTYSANHYTDPRYGIGYATAHAPLGPWVKAPDNPILARDSALRVSGPGHNGVIASPDGRERFLVYHSHVDPAAPSGRRLLNLDRLLVPAPGQLATPGPTRSPQPLPSGAAVPATPPAVVAHRGAWKAGGHPQNSLASLRAALDAGYGGSEFDVRVTADDTLVVAHDAEHAGLDVEATPYAALAARPLANGEPLPTLRAYLEAGLRQNPRAPTRLVLEVKPSPAGPERSAEIARRAVALVRAAGAAALTDYISFSYPALLAIRAADPAAHTEYLEGDKAPAELAADGIGGLDYHHLVYRRHPRWVAEAKALGLRLNAWTVNERPAMRRLIRQGFDRITTDEPARLRAQGVP